MNYIGSKKKLSEWLLNSIASHCDLEGQFLDAFGGTSIISQKLRPQMTVTCNDIELYSYRLAQHYIEGTDSYSETIEELSEAEPIEGFIYHNYCSSRMYWTPENGRKIDGIRSLIGELDLEGEELAAALCALLEAADSVANTAAVYGAYLKNYKTSAQRELSLKPIEPPQGIKGCALNRDVLDLKITGDVAYLDPPYNTRHYGANYHLLNTICHYEVFEPKGVTGLPDYYKSPFCSKVKAAGAMKQLLDQLDYRHIFISYNDEGIVPLEEMQSICSEAGQYFLIKEKYQRFKADAKRKTKQNSTVEYLHCIKRK